MVLQRFLCIIHTYTGGRFILSEDNIRFRVGGHGKEPPQETILGLGRAATLSLTLDLCGKVFKFVASYRGFVMLNNIKG